MVVVDWNLVATLIVGILAADLIKVVVSSVRKTYFR